MPDASRSFALAYVFSVATAACGGDDEPSLAESDAAVPDDGELCTPERDPHGTLCVADGLSLTSALAMARAEVGEHAGLVLVQSSGVGSLDFAGRDTHWSLEFEDALAGETVDLAVSPQGVSHVDRRPSELDCGPDGYIEALDSGRIVPDAVQRFEAELQVRVRSGSHNLFMRQHGCFLLGMPEGHHVAVLHHPTTSATEPEPASFYYVRYWDDGTFIEFVGPCAADLEACLLGQ